MNREEDLRIIVTERLDISKEILFDDGIKQGQNNIQAELARKLRSIESNLDLHAWLKDVKEMLEEKYMKECRFIELYVDLDGVGTVYSVPAMIYLSKILHNSEKLTGINLHIIDFDGEVYTNTLISKYQY